MPSESVAPPESWFHWLATNAQVVGIVGWVSLAVTVAGFWIAISQIRRVKSAAEAARAAALQMARVVRSREQHAKLTSAISYLGGAKAYLSQLNAEAARVCVEVACSSLVDARELSDNAGDQQKIQTSLVRLRKVGESLADIDPDADTAQQLKPHAIDVRKSVIVLEEVATRLRYKLDTPGDQ